MGIVAKLVRPAGVSSGILRIGKSALTPGRKSVGAAELIVGSEPATTCVCRKPRPFDLMKESRTIGHDGRATLLPFETVGFTVQADQAN